MSTLQYQQLADKYQTYEQLIKAIQNYGIESIQMVVGFDFSKSNEWTGQKTYGKPLHGLDYVNPYLLALNILEPIIPKFDDDGIIPAFRFGCHLTKDRSVLPLLAPQNPDPHFVGFTGLKDAYIKACETVKLSGPTTFAPMIYQTIEIANSYTQQQSKQLIVLLLLTDGDVSNFDLDCKAICEASSYPISIVALGLGDGPFDKMVAFDDMQGSRKFDNFQFVNFTQLQFKAAQAKNPELVLATAVFNELPEQYNEMKKLGIL